MLKVISFAVALSALFVVIQAQDSCFRCTSSISHLECIDTESAALTITQCNGAANNRTCFSRVDSDRNVVRGCLNELNNPSECDSDTCQICVGNNMPNGRDGCNYGVFPVRRLFCITCADGVDSMCAGNTNLTMTVCPFFDPEDRCYTARPNGNYERGCMSSSNTRCRGDNENCHICVGQGCNFEDYNSAMTIFSDAKVIGLVLLSIAFTTLNK